jgi:hypothetical protein
MSDPFCLPHTSFSEKVKTGQNKGQIVVEYVLLLLVAVLLATLITRAMVSRNSDKPGFVIQAWQGIISFIADDTPDDVAGPPAN